MFWHCFFIDLGNDAVNLIQVRLGIKRNVNQNPHISSRQIADDHDIAVGHKMKRSVRVPYLRRPNPDTDYCSSDVDRTVSQADIVTDI